MSFVTEAQCQSERSDMIVGQATDEVQTLKESFNEVLQKHEAYCAVTDRQLQVLCDQVTTLSTSMEAMEQRFQHVNMRLDEYGELRLPQMLKDVENAVGHVRSLSTSSDARFNSMAKEYDATYGAAGKEIRTLAAECQELLKVSVPIKDMDESLMQLTERIDKLEGEQVQGGTGSTSQTIPVASAEEMIDVMNTVKDLSLQIQTGMGEQRAFVEHIQELVLENQTLRACSPLKVHRVVDVDAPGCDCIQDLRMFENACLQQPSDAGAEGASPAQKLRAKSLDTQQKFSALAGALRVGSHAEDAGGERV